MQRKDVMNTQRFSKRFGSLALVVAALILVPSASSRAGPPYADPAGDSGSAADITGVTVLGNKGNGQFLFGVSGSNLSASPSQVTFLAIDSDANPDTGSSGWNGADYAFAVDDSGYDFVHWNGSDWVEAPSSTVHVCCVHGGSMMTFSVNRSELGNTSELNFEAKALNTDTKAMDDAPADGMYNYSLATGGPDIQGVTLLTTPSAGPRAGKPLVVTPVGLKLPPNGELSPVLPHPDSYRCRAMINGRALRGTGTGGCDLHIAKKTRGKKLNVVVTVTYEGATKRAPFTFVIS
jgi:hypothetical protein